MDLTGFRVALKIYPSKEKKKGTCQCQWVDLRENLNRKPSIFPWHLWEFPVIFPLNQPIDNGDSMFFQCSFSASFFGGKALTVLTSSDPWSAGMTLLCGQNSEQFLLHFTRIDGGNYCWYIHCIVTLVHPFGKFHV